MPSPRPHLADRLIQAITAEGGASTATNPELAARCTVATRTIKRALAHLATEGVVRVELAPRSGPDAAPSGRRIVLLEVTS